MDLSVSIITPTYNREAYLGNILSYFLSQNHPDLEWLVLDDSNQPSPTLGTLSHANICYQHSAQRLSIGMKRNLLIEKAKGDIIVQFDDDDFYGPDYVHTMVQALNDQNADVLNLTGWFVYDFRYHFFGYWDLMRKFGLHYCCDKEGLTPIIFDERNNRILKDIHLGFGFSYIFKKQVWDAIPFADRNWNEDGEFIAQAQAQFKIAGISDKKGMCLHFLHANSTSRCLPQYRLPFMLFERLFPTVKWGTQDPQSFVFQPET